MEAPAPGGPHAAERRREEVLAALVAAGDEGLAGTALAEALGCSRAAVHRHVEALRRVGVRVGAGPGGYRLEGGQDPVVPLLVRPRLVAPVAGPVHWHAEAGSTNDLAAALARGGAAEGLVVGADLQTAGRGRRGRPWVTDPAAGLLVSVVLRPALGPLAAGLLPIVVAVALAEAVEGLGADRVTIAWPNDVMLDGRKLAGILCELTADQESVAWAVAGVGLNVRPAPPLEGPRWRPTSLAEAGLTPPRGDALVALLRALSSRYAGWLAHGPGPVVAAFAARDHLAGRVVRMGTAEGEVLGEVLGLDSLGRLRLLTAGGERAMASGEVTGVDRT